MWCSNIHLKAAAAAAAAATTTLQILIIITTTTMMKDDINNINDDNISTPYRSISKHALDEPKCAHHAHSTFYLTLSASTTSSSPP